jgi:cytosine deaminase
VEVIAAEAIKRGNGARVSASHTTAFGSYNDSYAYKLLGFLQRAQINFIPNPPINITLQGRQDSYPKRRGLTRIKELWQNGINVSLGQDCIFDPWYIFGTGNVLDVAYLAVHVAQMTGLKEIDACFEMVTSNGARSLQIQDYGLQVGNPANVVVVDAPSAFEAVRQRAKARYVISRGKLIAQTEPAQTLMSPTGIALSG